MIASLKKMLYIRMHKPTLNVQTDAIRAKVEFIVIYAYLKPFLKYLKIACGVNPKLN